MSILKNNSGQILSLNGTPLVTTWDVSPTPSYPTDGLVARWDFDDTYVDTENSYTLLYVYNKALSDAEVAELYNNGSGI